VKRKEIQEWKYKRAPNVERLLPHKKSCQEGQQHQNEYYNLKM